MVVSPTRNVRNVSFVKETTHVPQFLAQAFENFRKIRVLDIMLHKVQIHGHPVLDKGHGHDILTARWGSMGGLGYMCFWGGEGGATQMYQDDVDYY